MYTMISENAILDIRLLLVLQQDHTADKFEFFFLKAAWNS